MSKVISIDDIEEGMVNLEPIVNRYGQTLLAPGVKLSPQHMMILKTWNIRTIKISGGEEEETSTISEELKLMIIERIRKRANWQPRIPIEEDLLSAAIMHNAKTYMKKNEQG